MKLKDLIDNFGECEVPQELVDKFELLKRPKTKTIWDLEYNDLYNWIDEEGDIDTHYWCADGIDLNIRKVGNAFVSYEEAEKEVERREVETLLLKHGGRRWFKEGGKENWFIAFNRSEGLFKSFYTIKDQQQGTIYFNTYEQAQKAIEQIGEERLIKVLFEVR